jgi:hypothetical protein
MRRASRYPVLPRGADIYQRVGDDVQIVPAPHRFGVVRKLPNVTPENAVPSGRSGGGARCVRQA